MRGRHRPSRRKERSEGWLKAGRMDELTNENDGWMDGWMEGTRGAFPLWLEGF